MIPKFRNGYAQYATNKEINATGGKGKSSILQAQNRNLK